MSGKLFTDGDLSLIKDKTISIIGYGNQGRAHGIVLKEVYNMNVIVGSIKDASWDKAVSDGFNVYNIREAVERSDIILLLLPDEIAPKVYEMEVEPALKEKKWCLIDFASGYNVMYDYIKCPPNADVIMVAPRMIGAGILDLVKGKGRGYPVLLGVAQDISGKAWDYACALSKGIGAFLPGGIAVESSFEEEAMIDLFTEHFIGPQTIAVTTAAFELLTEEYGVSPAAAILELYASEEWSEIFKAMAEVGFFKQMRFHSRTSQYGQFTRAYKILQDQGLKQKMRETLTGIVNGEFAREWSSEQTLGYPVFNRVWRLFEESKMSKEEDRLYRALKRRQ